MAFGPLFPTAINFSVGWDCFYIGNRLQQTQPNQIRPRHPIYTILFILYYLYYIPRDGCVEVRFCQGGNVHAECGWTDKTTGRKTWTRAVTQTFWVKPEDVHATRGWERGTYPTSWHVPEVSRKKSVSPLKLFFFFFFCRYQGGYNILVAQVFRSAVRRDGGGASEKQLGMGVVEYTWYIYRTKRQHGLLYFPYNT